MTTRIPISGCRHSRWANQDSSARLAVAARVVPPFPAGHFGILLARLACGCASHFHGPVELIPAQRQTLWGPLAVANFAVGGLGAGFYVMAAVLTRFGASASGPLATWLGPVLVLAGFTAVGLEAGRPRRGYRLLARLGSSWMSRELLLGGTFVALAVADLVGPAPVLRTVAVLTAVGFVLAQGWVVRSARGIAAWNVAVMPALFLSSALVSGAGLSVLIEAISRRSIGGASLGLPALFLVLGAVTWLTYVTWSSDETFLRPTRPLRQGVAAAGVVGAGHALPFVLLVLAIPLGDVAAAGVTLAGALMVAMQVYAKSLVILTVAELRPITLARLTPGRRAR